MRIARASCCVPGRYKDVFIKTNFSRSYAYGCFKLPLPRETSLAGHLETVALRGGELKGSPPGWRMVCRMSRPHGLKGGRTFQRAECTANNFGLDEEMLQAA
jgi:hypothetical protein